ncbi:hypothetical protein ACM78Z_27240 [Pseudomonas aeruginosa]
MPSIFRRCAIAISPLVLAIILQGCGGMAAWNFKPAEASGQGKGGVDLYLHEANGQAAEKYSPAQATLTAYPKLQDALSACKPEGPGIQALSAVIAPVVGKLLFDLYMDKQARDLDALKESAEKSYHGRMVLHADSLQRAVSRGRCFVLIRTSDDDKVPQFISVLKLERAPLGLIPGHAVEAFAFRPTYVAARSAVAVTRKAEDARISVSLALSVRGIGRQDNGLPSFAQVGEAATTIPKLPIGRPISPQGASCYAKRCPISDPIPLVTGTSTLVVGIGITEKGDIGVEFDSAKSELSAIKAAMGPVISDVLKEKLK